METDKLKSIMDTKNNGGPQLNIVEMGDPNNRTNTRPSTSAENKKSG